MKNKLLLLFIIFLFSFSTSNAQRYSLDVGLSYSAAFPASGIHLKFDSWFSENFGAALEFENYFFEGEDKWNTMSFRLKYNFINREGFDFYALGGAQIINFSSEDLFVKGGETHNGTTYTTDYSLSGNKASDIGGHLGIGVAKIFNDHFKFFMENKITFNPFVKDLTTFSNLSRNQFIPTIGLGYQF